MRGDNVKDDPGGHAVLTDQGASSSHLTAAIVLDTIAQLPGMSGEANYAVSRYTQVKSGFLETVARNIGITSMTQCSHQNEIFLDIHWQGW